MKKIITIFLLIIYTATALGVTINSHYCMGSLTDVSLSNFGGKTGCSCKPGPMQKDCCKDELIYEKAADHKTVKASYTNSPISFTPDFPPVSDRYNMDLQAGNYGSDIFYNYVWRSCPQPIYLLINVFRI